MTRRLLVTLAVATLALPAGTAVAGPADLDPTFGSGGKTSLSSGDDRVRDVALAPDGKIVVVYRATSAPAASYEVVRFNADGSEDLSFGVGGSVSVQLGGLGAATASPNAVAVEPDGDVVVAGWSFATGGNAYDATIVRLDGSDGGLDAGFSGDGVWIDAHDDGIDRRLFDVRALDNGTILGAGSAGDRDIPTSGFYAVRVAADGSNELASDEDPRATTDVFADEGARAIAPDGGGGFYVAGTLRDGSNVPTVAVRRYTENLQAVATFGDAADGYAVSAIPGDSWGEALAVTTGRIFVGGYVDASTDGIALARFELDGKRDTAFGVDGFETYTLAGAGDVRLGDLTATSDGKLLAAAGLENGAAANTLALLRFDFDGSADLTFGGDGVSDGTRVGDDWPHVSPLGDTDGSYLQSVSVALQADGKAVAAATALQDGDGAIGLARFGAADIAPPPPADGGGGGGGGGGSAAPPAGGASPGPGADPAPAPVPAGPTPQHVGLVRTTEAARMPDLRGREVQAAIRSLDRRLFADVTIRYSNDDAGRARDIGEITRQSPAPRARVSSAPGDSRNVTLTVYEGRPPVGSHRCPESELRRELKGLGPVFAEQVAKQLKCRVEVEVVPNSRARGESVSKVTAKNNRVVLTVTQPTKPERNELVLAFGGFRPSNSVATFNADDWSLCACGNNAMTITVMTKGGDLVKGATVTIDASDVGGRDASRLSGTDAPGAAHLGFQARKPGRLSVSARGEVGGQIVTGTAVIDVREQSTYTTVNGDRVEISRGRIARVSQAPRARSAGFGDLFNALLQIFGLSSPTSQQLQQGASREQTLSAQAKQRRIYPVQIALGQPLGPASRLSNVQLSDVNVIANGRVGTTRAPVVAAGGGNVVAAGGANAIAASGGASVVAAGSANVVAAGSGNAIYREIDLRRAQIISDNGLGLLGPAAGNLISDNGLGLISDNGLGLVPRPSQLVLSSFPSVVAAGGLN